ncbi:MAG: cytochrome c biogenesis protein ResB [Planctomycetes bacterium]|nr:cytochrome c biogenesis protein ResB [Planctomycetota bacterium]
MIALAGLSIVGAFMPADSAKDMFNSGPLVAYWLFLAALLIAGLVSFNSLVRRAALIAVHVGPLLILAGAMYGSGVGHRLTARLFADLGMGVKKKVPAGYLPLFVGKQNQTLYDASLENKLGKLPFSIELKDLRIERYGPWAAIAIPHATQQDAGSGQAGYVLRPIGPVRDYVSDLAVLVDGRQAARKTIEVNHPLHFGGYHFYQQESASQDEQYTILLVKSDSGLVAVYAGMALLCAGVFWQLWFSPAWNCLKRRAKGGR